MNLFTKASDKITGHSTITQIVTVHYKKLFYSPPVMPKYRIEKVEIKISIDWDKYALGVAVDYISIPSMTVNGVEFLNVNKTENLNNRIPFAIAELNLRNYIINGGETLTIKIPFSTQASISGDQSPGLILEYLLTSTGGSGTVVYTKTF